MNIDLKSMTAEFGSYPQENETDSTTISTLNEKAGTLPSSSNKHNWKDYGYYISGSVQSYMYYIDIDLDNDGEYDYRGVYFTSYRPYYCSSTSSTSNSNQDENGYNTNTVYWFKYEPIVWDIVKTEGTKYTLVSRYLIDSQQYDYDGSYSNNYQESTIRKWLNETFFNQSFNSDEKELIQTTLVDNSAASTGYDANDYACSNTNDKVFLLSYVEATTYYTSDSARIASGTDYAKSQGLYVYSGYQDKYGNSSSHWWLRSPNDYNSGGACCVSDYGYIYGSHSVDDSYGGVRVSLVIDLENKSDTTSKPDIDLDTMTVKFGSYPQTMETDSTIISILNKKAGAMPSSSNKYNWNDYGYYIDGTVQSYMYCIDLDLDNDDEYDYRGVYFTSYRLFDCDKSSNTYDSHQDDNGYIINTVYWFKYEPIVWDIVKTEETKYTLVSRYLIDSQQYDYEQGKETCGNNNYQESTIRKWLNDTFYNQAFNDEEKDIIQTILVDNSVASTGDSSNQYACSNTNDKVLLLSFKEVTTYYTAYDNIIINGRASGTDYAKSQGLWVTGEEYTDTYGNSSSGWWLRSPASFDSSYSRIIGCSGGLGGTSIVYNTYYGVRPCIVININK